MNKIVSNKLSLNEGSLEGLKSLKFWPDIYKEFNLFVNQRQSKAINQSKSSVENSINHLRLNQSIEFAVSDLKDSIDFLGEIVGKKDNEDMLDTLFSTFCIGK